MVKKNDPGGAADYQYRCDWAASYVVLAPIQYISTGSFTQTWGNGFSAGTTGWKIAISTNTDDPTIIGDQTVYTITFSCPWHADVVVTAASWLSSASCRVEVDDELLVGTCDTFTHSFSELRFKVGATTHLTVSAQSDSGTGYDPRHNIDAISTIATSNPALPSDPTGPGCTADFPGASDIVQSSTADITGGWRYTRDGGSTWTYPDIAIEFPSVPDEPGCSGCVPTYGFTYTNSWDVYVHSRIYLRDLTIDGGIVTCSCAGGSTGTAHAWSIEQTFHSLTSSVNLHRKDGPIVKHNYLVSATCNGGAPDEESGTVTGAYTICELTQDAGEGFWRSCCLKYLTPFICPPGVPVTCDFDCTEVSCLYLLEFIITWPDKPNCSDASGPNYIVQDNMGRLHLATIKRGDIWYKRSNDTRSADGWVSTVQVTTRGDIRKCAFDYDSIYKRIELYYETTAHDVYYTYSVGDEGQTWHTPALVGSNMIDFFTATNHMNDDRIRCWFVYNSGTSGPGKAKGQFRHCADAAWSSVFTFKSSGSDLAIADGGMCNVAFAHSNQNELTWNPLINGDTDASTWFSNDEGKNWRLQP